MLFVSIVGDSISTFEGYNPPGYAVYYDRQMQTINGLEGVADTWWALTLQQLRAYLCVNNSYSGSMVSGEGFPAASDQARTSALANEAQSPDCILIYIGFNDFGNGITVRNTGYRLHEGKSPLFFEDAYGIMIDRIKERYPGAAIICGTLMRTKLKYREEWVFPEDFAGVAFEEYNRAIRRTAAEKNVYLADLGALDARYETFDGAHPTKEGHRTIADAWLTCLADLGLPKDASGRED